MTSPANSVPHRRRTGLPSTRPLLEPAIHRFKAFERIEQLQTGLSNCVRARRELLGVLDRKFDTVDGDSRLVGHLEFNRRRARMNIGLDLFKNLMHCFRTHWNSPLAISLLPRETRSAVSVGPAARQARR